MLSLSSPHLYIHIVASELLIYCERRSVFGFSPSQRTHFYFILDSLTCHTFVAFAIAPFFNCRRLFVLSLGSLFFSEIRPNMPLHRRDSLSRSCYYRPSLFPLPGVWFFLLPPLAYDPHPSLFIFPPHTKQSFTSFPSDIFSIFEMFFSDRFFKTLLSMIYFRDRAYRFK